MYEVDSRDSVQELAGVPQWSIGAPVPLVISDDGRTVLAYYLEEVLSERDGRTTPNLSDQVAIIRFASCYALMFGPPNDEAFDGHPLASRGLEPYRAFEVH